MYVTVHCDDGSDRNCHEEVKTELSFHNLSSSNVVVNWTVNRGKEEVDIITITPPKPVEEWIDQNSHALDESQIESIRETGSFTIDYRELESVVCSACGSDQTYDDEGRNITSD